MRLINQTTNIRGAVTFKPISRGPGHPRRQGGVTQDGFRDRLLDIAVILLTRDSVDPAALAIITRETGVMAPMVHYHLKSRNQLLDAVMEERTRSLIDQVTHPTLTVVTDDAHLLGLAQTLTGMA